VRGGPVAAHQGHLIRVQEGHPLLDRGPQGFFQSRLAQFLDVEQTVGQVRSGPHLRRGRCRLRHGRSLVLGEDPLQMVGDGTYGFGGKSTALRQQSRSDLLLPQQPDPAQPGIDAVPRENHHGLDRDRGHPQGRHRRLGHPRHGQELGCVLTAGLASSEELSLQNLRCGAPVLDVENEHTAGTDQQHVHVGRPRPRPPAVDQ
jgi:hypothetical protein